MDIKLLNALIRLRGLPRCPTCSKITKFAAVIDFYNNLYLVEPVESLYGKSRMIYDFTTNKILVHYAFEIATQKFVVNDKLIRDPQADLSNNK